MPSEHDPRRAAKLTRLAGGVWALGFVSLFMDVSSEMIHGLLPVFLVGTLGVSAAGLGLIEGVAESTAAMTKLFSGWWSDRMGRRKPLALLGYCLGALTKPMFPLADSAVTVLAARFINRIGKGIRGAPRGVLVAFGRSPIVIFAGVAVWGLHMGMTEGLLAAMTADYAPAELRSTAFGVVNFVRAVMLLLGSVVAGALWSQFGPETTFLTAAALALLAGLLTARGVKAR